jgi:hypothetical protein
VSPKSQGLNPVDLETFKESMNIFFDPKHNPLEQSEDTSDGKPATSFGIKWKQLLDAIDAKGDMRADQAETSVRTEQSQATPSPPSQLLDFEQVQMQNDYNDRRLAATLREELRALTDGFEVINWMNDRLFSPDNPDALINKVSNTAEPPSRKILDLYSFLLKDVTDVLRHTAPHASLLPLRIASSHSPASYLHGCTAAVYAAAMRAQWEVWGDVEGCLALLEEMERGAVAHSFVIIELVSNISDALNADAMRATEAAEASMAAAEDSENLFEVTSRVRGPASKESAERERIIDQHMFFGSSQRKALARMEELVIQHRERHTEALRREDAIEEAIRRREKAGTEGMSDVNALANSFGQPRLYAGSQFSHQEARRAGQTERELPQHLVERRERAHRAKPRPVSNHSDMLSEAIDEVAGKVSTRASGRATRTPPKRNKQALKELATLDELIQRRTEGTHSPTGVV